MTTLSSLTPFSMVAYHATAGLFFGRFSGNSTQLELPVFDFLGEFELEFILDFAGASSFWPKILEFFAENP